MKDEGMNAGNKSVPVRADGLVWKERLGKRFPDRKLEKDEDYDRVMVEFMDGVEVGEKGFKDANDRMIELLKMNPELASVVDDMLKNHAPFRVALVKHYGAEDLTPQEGDEDYEGWKAAYQQRRKRLEERDCQLRELVENETASMQVIEDFCREKDMTDEQQDDFMEACDQEIAAVVRKKVSQRFLETMWKGIHAEELQSEAAREAEIRTRNEKIEIARKREEKNVKGDGVPAPTQNGGERKEKKGDGFLDDILGKRDFI